MFFWWHIKSANKEYCDLNQSSNTQGRQVGGAPASHIISSDYLVVIRNYLRVLVGSCRHSAYYCKWRCLFYYRPVSQASNLLLVQLCMIILLVHIVIPRVSRPGQLGDSCDYITDTITRGCHSTVFCITTCNHGQA